MLLTDFTGLDAVAGEIANEFIEGGIGCTDIGFNQGSRVIFRGFPRFAAFSGSPQSQHPQSARAGRDCVLLVMRKFRLDGLFPTVKARHLLSPRLTHILSAVDRQRRTGDEARVVGCKKHHRARYIPGLAQPAHGNEGIRMLLAITSGATASSISV